jgi:arylsulfatase A-like enzyme
MERSYYRRLHHGYYACVSYIDSLVGQLLDELERLELADDTIVILWGDHGFQLGERSLTGKHNTLDLSLRVPVILRVPGAGKKGVRSEALFSSIDIFPTLVELAGLEEAGSPAGRQLCRHVRRILRPNSATVSIAGSSGLLRFLPRASPTPALTRAARCFLTMTRIRTKNAMSPAIRTMRIR